MSDEDKIRKNKLLLLNHIKECLQDRGWSDDVVDILDYILENWNEIKVLVAAIKGEHSE